MFYRTVAKKFGGGVAKGTNGKQRLLAGTADAAAPNVPKQSARKLKYRRLTIYKTN